MRFRIWFRFPLLIGAALILLPLLASCARVATPPAPTAAATAPASQPATPYPTATPLATAPAPAATQPAPTKPAVVPTAAATGPSAPAQGAPTTLDGDWSGPLKLPGQDLNMVVRFQSTEGALKATMDVPAQGAKDIPLTNVSQQGTHVHFEALSGQRLAVYDAELVPDGSMAGNFEQLGVKATFVLQHVAAQPTAVLPYDQENVTYQNGAVTLACTLSTPPAGGPFPAVVLITGSGAQNRDEDLFGFQPFRLMADYLTRNGIAVLRCDDRGVGGSTGGIAQSTSDDFAGDVLAGVNMLKARPDINPKQIGLWGHSEGGLIAPMVAAKSSDVAFIVLMSGPGVPGDQIVQTQLVDIETANGAPQADIDKALAHEKRILDAVKTGQGWDAVKADLTTQARSQVAAMTTEQVQALGGADKAVATIVQSQVDSVDNAWFKFFLSYDPAPTLVKVKVPVLALFGGKDMQVKTAPNEAAIRAALESGGNKQLTVKVFPDANHLYQEAVTGSPNEYATLKKEFVPGLLEYVTGWIKGILG